MKTMPMGQCDCSHQKGGHPQKAVSIFSLGWLQLTIYSFVRKIIYPTDNISMGNINRYGSNFMKIGEGEQIHRKQQLCEGLPINPTVDRLVSFAPFRS